MKRILSGKTTSYEANEGAINHGFADGCMHLIVLTQATEAIEPAKGTLHNPPFGQDLKGLGGALDDFHPDMFATHLFDGMSKIGSRIALIHPNHLESGELSCCFMEDNHGSQPFGSIGFCH